MKRFLNALFLTLAVACFALSAYAQDNADDGDESKSSGVVRRTTKKKKAAAKQPGVTPRMEEFYIHKDISDADMEWMRVIYRSLDLSKVQNAPLYYPEEPIDNQENLFRIIMRLLTNDQIAAYEYLDGREIFTDQYRIKVKDMLERFHIPFANAKGSTNKHPKFKIEESDVPANEVLSYYILERWEFDRVSNQMHRRVEALCPVLHRSGDFGGEAVRYPMFWVKFDALRPTLSQQYIFTTDDNNFAHYTYDDFFNLSMYDGEIYKTRNLRNLSMMQMFPDPDELKRAQDSIDYRLNHYADGLWVPTRDELAKEAKAKKGKKKKGTEVASRDGEEPDEEVAEGEEAEEKSSERRSSSSKRGKKNKAPKVKQPKVKNNSANSSATRSVRRRK